MAALLRPSHCWSFSPKIAALNIPTLFLNTPFLFWATYLETKLNPFLWVPFPGECYSCLSALFCLHPVSPHHAPDNPPLFTQRNSPNETLTSMRTLTHFLILPKLSQRNIHFHKAVLCISSFWNWSQGNTLKWSFFYVLFLLIEVKEPTSDEFYICVKNWPRLQNRKSSSQGCCLFWHTRSAKCILFPTPDHDPLALPSPHLLIKIHI